MLKKRDSIPTNWALFLFFVSLSFQLPVCAGTFLANQAKLDAVKTSLQNGEKTYSRNYLAIMSKAKKLLKMEPLSVATKEQMPPSGDKHDYMSLATYWWPDPSGDKNAPYIRKDGEHNPEIYDYKDPDNYPLVCRNIFHLALAYYLSDETVYAEKAIRLTRCWFLDTASRMNPNFTYAQAIKGRNDGRGSGLIENRDIIYVVDAVELLKTSKLFSNNDVQGMKKWFSDFLQWMITSKNGHDESKAQNNHGSWYDCQVLSLSLATGNRELALKHANRIFEKIGKQITPEGKQPAELERTNAYHYSFFNLEALGNLARLAANVGVDGWNYTSPDGGSIKKAIEFMYPYTINEKPFPYKQLWERKKSSPVRVYVYAYGAYGESKYLKAAEEINGGALYDIPEMLFL